MREPRLVTGATDDAFKTVWPSGLRRWLQAPVRKGVGSNPTAVILTTGLGLKNLQHLRSDFMPKRM